MKENASSPRSRRIFLTQVGAGMSVAGAAAIATASAQPQATATEQWQPQRHSQDDWMDGIAGKHRLVFDTTTPAGFSSALLYTNNYYLANTSGYGLQDGDQAVIIIARHISTPYAYNNGIWAKYGAPISAFVSAGANPASPRVAEPPTTNTYGRQLEGLIKRGVHFAVCGMATQAIAGSIARTTGGTADAIAKELAANVLPNAHVVPAGIVTVNRAQERGYTLVVGG